MVTAVNKWKASDQKHPNYQRATDQPIMHAM